MKHENNVLCILNNRHEEGDGIRWFKTTVAFSGGRQGAPGGAGGVKGITGAKKT